MNLFNALLGAKLGGGGTAELNYITMTVSNNTRYDAEITYLGSSGECLSDTVNADSSREITLYYPKAIGGGGVNGALCQMLIRGTVTVEVASNSGYYATPYTHFLYQARYNRTVAALLTKQATTRNVNVTISEVITDES